MAKKPKNVPVWKLPKARREALLARWEAFAARASANTERVIADLKRGK